MGGFCFFVKCDEYLLQLFSCAPPSFSHSQLGTSASMASPVPLASFAAGVYIIKAGDIVIRLNYRSNFASAARSNSGLSADGTKIKSCYWCLHRFQRLQGSRSNAGAGVRNGS